MENIEPTTTASPPATAIDPAFRRKIEFAVVYVFVLAVGALVMQVYPRLSLLLPLTFPLALLEEKPKKFLVAWLPVASIVVAYELMRGAIDADAAYVNYSLLPSLEVGLFGGHPIIWLQERLMPLIMTPLGAFPTLVYFAHYFVPVVLMYALWKRNAEYFTTAAMSLVVLSFTAYATFLVFPAAPPWMASEAGTIPPIRHVVVEHLGYLFTVIPSIDYASAYGEMTANPVAPFPSLHAGFGMLMALWGWFFFHRHRWLGIAYGLAASFVIVMYGEHYVVDVLGGWAYAAGSFALSVLMVRHRLVQRFVRYIGS